MKKKFRLPIVPAIVILLTLILVVVRYSNTLNIAKITSSSNSPSFDSGELLFFSKFKKGGKGDFMVYHEENQWDGAYLDIGRLVAVGGDVLEIKTAELFVNGESFDTDLELKFYYHLIDSVFDRVRDLSGIEIVRESNFQGIYSMTKSRAEELGLGQHLMIESKLNKESSSAQQIQSLWGEDWTRDFFGPITIPDHHFFVIRDNRHNSLDSRYLGFIPQEDVIGFVLD